METPHLLDLLNAEAATLRQIDYKWRPHNLFYELQTQDLMKDMIHRFKRLVEAKEEFVVLDRAEVFMEYLRRMRFIVRRAYFVRRSNHVAFAQAVSDFYGLYGEILRRLKVNQARGRLQPEV